MTCYNPKFAYIKKGFYYPKDDTNIVPTPTRLLKFIPRIAVDDETEKRQDVVALPCRKCIGCILDKANDWATRASMEAKQWKNNCFITLTYNNENIPKNRSLRKRDYQLFLKKLRKHEEGFETWIRKGKKEKPIRYFIAGEYGPQTKRPHYHIAIFNWKPNDLIFHSWNSNHEPLFTSKTLEKYWGKGYTIVGNLTYESACYIARYTMKKLGKQIDDNRLKIIDELDKARLNKMIKLEENFSKNMDTLEDAILQERIEKLDKGTNELIENIKKNKIQKEFIEVSRNGGIGLKHWENNKKQIKEDMAILTATKSGAKYKKIPEFIKNKWRKENPEEYIELCEQYAKKVREESEKIFEKTSLTRDQYRQQMLEHKLAQIKALKRTAI